MVDKALGFILSLKTNEIDVDSNLGEFGVTNEGPPSKLSQKRRRVRKPSSAMPLGHVLIQ